MTKIIKKEITSIEEKFMNKISYGQLLIIKNIFSTHPRPLVQNHDLLVPNSCEIYFLVTLLRVFSPRV